MQTVTIDGRQLNYPGTGLALVTAELIHAFDRLRLSTNISVFVGHSFNAGTFDLTQSSCRFLAVSGDEKLAPGARWMSRALTVHDYIERLIWAGEIAEKLSVAGRSNTHFIPYLYNYGASENNVVLIPDLIWRHLPEPGQNNPQRSLIWNLRHHLPLRKWLCRLEERLALDARRIIVYSNFVRDFVHKELNVPLAKMTLMPLAAPSWVTKQYQPLNDAIVKAKYQLPERFVLYVGGFGYRKNVPLLLRACAALRRKDPQFKCVMVGLSRQLLQSGVAPTIAKVMHDDNVQEAILPLAFLDYPDLASLYRLSAFTVYPSLSEGFGLPVLEAAAAKRLCLCADNTSLKEVQSLVGYRVAESDLDAWVEKIFHFWKDPELAKSAGLECAQLSQNYSWNESAKILWDILQQDIS